MLPVGANEPPPPGRSWFRSTATPWPTRRRRRDARRARTRTVAKHLERTYRKLGVPDRSRAAAMAWTLARRW